MRRTAPVWIAAALLGAAVMAQQRKPTFEVASVKVQQAPFSPGAGDRAFPRAMPGGVFSPTHATVELLLHFAYDMKRFQVIGGPDWIRQIPFHIEARAGRDVPADELKLMVQSLLEDRFALRAHLEERTTAVTALVRARPDGSLGPYLRQVGDDCNASTAAAIRSEFPPRQVSGGAALQGQCSGISVLADYLALAWEEPVIDKTGLTGKFVHDLRAASIMPNSRPLAANADPRLPPLAVALEEQLALKLERRQEPVKVIVIDSVQQPTEN